MSTIFVAGAEGMTRTGKLCSDGHIVHTLAGEACGKVGNEAGASIVSVVKGRELFGLVQNKGLRSSDCRRRHLWKLSQFGSFRT